MNDRLFVNMVGAAASELTHVMDISLRERAKDLVKRVIGRPVHVSDPMFWPAGILMLGLAQARKTLKAGAAVSEGGETLIDDIDRAFSGHLDLWAKKFGSKITFVDDALAGAALIMMYEQTSEEKYKEAAQKIYEFVVSATRDEAGSIIYNASKGNRNIFADGVGQTAMFLSVYGRRFDKPEAVELAKTQLLNFKKFGMDEGSGLCYHGYELQEAGVPVKKGILGWGRAMGWLMMGLSAYAAEADDYELTDWYREMSAITASYSRKEGGYSWQIQAVDGHFDSSATGMLAYSLMVGNNCLNKQDAQDNQLKAVNGSFRALESITDSQGIVDSALSACEDFGVHYQNYGHYPWGQGAALAAVSLGGSYAGLL